MDDSSPRPANYKAVDPSTSSAYLIKVDMSAVKRYGVVRTAVPFGESP